MTRTKTTDKASVKNGRAKRGGEAYNANHNTLEATRLNQAHIDNSRLRLNQYIRYDDGKPEVMKGGSGGFNAKQHEMELYKKFYSEGLEARNERYRYKGHEEDCKTMEQLYSNPKTAPLETIFQVGSTDSVIDKDTRTSVLIRAWNATLNEMRTKFGENFVPADAALHLDEAQPHIHFRSLLMARDKFGHLVPNQTKALEAMGFERPDMTQPKSRYNNALISFTDKLRETFYRNCERQGIQINREVENPSKRQVSILEHKCEKMRQEVQTAEQRAAQSRQEAQEAAITKQTVEGQVNTLRERIAALEGSQSLLEASKQTLTTENDTLRTRCKELETEIKGLEIQLSEINKQREQAEKDKKKAEEAKKQAEEAKQQVESEKAKAEAETVQAQKERQIQVDAIAEIQQHSKDLYGRLNTRKLRIIEKLPAQEEIKRWGKVVQEAKPARTVVATEDLEKLCKQAEYNVHVECNLERMSKINARISNDEIIQGLQARVKAQEGEIKRLEAQNRGLHKTVSERDVELADRQEFMERTGVEEPYQNEQYIRSQSHVYHHRHR